MNRSSSAYSAAGVDIDAKMSVLARLKKRIAATRTAGVTGAWGSFGGLFRSPGKSHLLVSSTDGVGTKLKVAVRAGRHDTVGRDLVNHCVNDILVQGARPLFFLDYIGMSRIDAPVLEQIVGGICAACKENGCALIGGETAELPDLYPDGEYDLVGTIVGSVKRSELITGEEIRRGDVLIGLPSSGLHTNGYSLARAVVFRKAQLECDDIFPGTDQTVADVLLAVHRSYLKPVSALMKKIRIRGMAHITGGGFPDNLPRILPRRVNAVIDRSAWSPPAVFQFIQETGGIDRDEMYRVFNMGIGLVIVVRPEDESRALSILVKSGESPCVIGRIERGSGKAILL
ncbi:MAG: phosphoribosylformylglycinamidine cyclo-ligase [Kiritimatiellae bacterium]|nr:phosphoribosylformylglycinamidine cyclo-ligase [Kiritimatiellia bacterium]MDW8458349.1 phosphoribosylformylglycinamidine cyclo-ligase [Verrucomicrobiota bacterium]